MSKKILIQDGPYQAELISIGAGLVSLRKNHPEFGLQDLVVPFDADEVPVGYKGKTLVPWPNRITGGKYSFQGHDYELPVNEASTGAALHGLACWEDWEVTAQSTSAVTFAVEICPSPYYPHSLHCQVQYSLDASEGLNISISATNTGSSAAPYGTSTHPYLTCNLAKIDDCILTIPAGTVWATDQRLHPVTLQSVQQLDLDYRSGKQIGAQTIDHAFGEVTVSPNLGDSWQVRLSDPQTQMSVVMQSDVPWVQVYSGDNIGRVGAAVEPMTCPPNAFNSGIDLIRLEPGESTTFTCKIFAQ